MPDVEPRPDSTVAAAPAPAGRALRSDRARFLAMSATCTGLLVTMTEFLPAPGRPSLTVGVGDHIVLVPLGIHWADPQAFAGDWFMTNAPQPHWLFDYIVEFGWSIGRLPWVLVAYWLLTYAVVGLATAVLARAWAPRHPWAAVVGWTFLAGVIPYNVAGSSWLSYPSAVPNMLGAALLYLLTACLLIGRYRAILVLLPLVTAVHVQIGAIALGITALAGLVRLWQSRLGGPGREVREGSARASRTAALPYLAVWLLCVGGTLAVLKLRSVAAVPADFIEICNTLIPYHCSAGQWPVTWVYVVLACVTLTLAAGLYQRRGGRLIYYATIGVCAVGTLVAVLLDRHQVPVLGELMQAYNGYRVGLAMYPFAAWGLLLPVLRPARTPARAVTAAVVCVAMPFLFVVSGAKIQFGERRMDFGLREAALIGLFVLIAVMAARGRREAAPEQGRRVRRTTAALCGWVLIAGFSTYMFVAWPASPVSWAGPDGAKWGRQARAIIPPGSQYLAAPSEGIYRLNSLRGTVVDCKNIPYGGPAYGQWKERLGALGGWSRCTDDAYFAAIPAADLVAVADRYGADAIITRPDEDRDQVRDLRALGWTYHRVGAGHLDTAILLRPGVQPSGQPGGQPGDEPGEANER